MANKIGFSATCVLSSLLILACGGGEPGSGDSCGAISCEAWEFCTAGVCGPAYGRCGEPGDGTCNQGQTCSPDHYCVNAADPCRNAACDSWKHCEAGACVLDDGRCDQPPDCQQNQTCSPDHNCVNAADPCASVDCDDWKYCEAGACVLADGRCEQSADCLFSQTCTNHTCVVACDPDDCEEWEECGPATCQLKQGRCYNELDCVRAQVCNQTHTCLDISCEETERVGDLEVTAVGAETAAKISSIGGALLIETTDLERLPHFACLEEIGGDLVVRGNHRLTSLRGLEHLTEIGGSLLIKDNGQLEGMQTGLLLDGHITCAGLLGLQSVGGGFEVVNNDAMVRLFIKSVGINSLNHVTIKDNRDLENTIGLGSLTEIRGNIAVENNEHLKYILPGANIAAVNGSVVIKANPDLAVIYAFATDEDTDVVIEQDLIVENNTSLGGVTGLSRLTEVRGALRVVENGVESLYSLKTLESVGGDFEIRGNLQLTLLLGYDFALHTVTGNLIIVDNPQVPDLQIKAVREQLGL